MKSGDLGGLVESEEVLQLVWDRVVGRFKDEEKNFGENSVINGKPIELSADCCYKVTLLPLLLSHSALVRVFI